MADRRDLVVTASGIFWDTKSRSFSTERHNSDQRASGVARTPASEALGAPAGTFSQHLRSPWLPKGAWSARKYIVAFLGYARDVRNSSSGTPKAHAASCLDTFDMEQQDALLSSLHNTDTRQNTRVIFDPGLEESNAEEVKDEIYEPEPLEELTALTQPDKLEVAHEQLVLVGFDKTTLEQQNDITHGAMHKTEDHEGQETLGYTTDDSNDFACIMTVDDLSTQNKEDEMPELVVGSDSSNDEEDDEDDKGESTRASSLIVAALIAEKVNTTS